MELTNEQTAVVDHVTSTEGITSVSAVSGAGKTSLLVAIAAELKPKNACYLAYNKAIAQEASRKFSSTVKCSTTHSLAYANTVRPFNLRVGFFSYRDIKTKMCYEDKLAVVDTLRDFCLSEFTTVSDYTDSVSTSQAVSSHVKKALDDMQEGRLDVTHEFYLKMYHILLANGHIDCEPYDLLMLDEAGDLNPVTLEIFKLLPATRKVMVGDKNQNIYSFNGTINGFEAIGPECTPMYMTQSFRVDEDIAESIEAFCQKELDSSMIFKGVHYDDKSIVTSAFISRTNGALIAEMITLNRSNSPYNLVRPAKQIFMLPLLLLGLKPHGFIANPQYKHLQVDVDEFHKGRSGSTSLLSYILKVHNDDVQLRTAVGLILKYSPKGVLDAFRQAASHEGTKHSHTLCTAHSSKG